MAPPYGSYPQPGNPTVSTAAVPHGCVSSLGLWVWPLRTEAAAGLARSAPTRPSSRQASGGGFGADICPICWPLLVVYTFAGQSSEAGAQADTHRRPAGHSASSAIQRPSANLYPQIISHSEDAKQSLLLWLSHGPGPQLSASTHSRCLGAPNRRLSVSRVTTEGAGPQARTGPGRSAIRLSHFPSGQVARRGFPAGHGGACPWEPRQPSRRAASQHVGWL